MIRIEHTVVIRRPVGEVFQFLTNPENNSLWQEGVVKSRKISQGSVGVGTQGEDTRKYIGRDLRTTYEIMEYEADRKLGFRSLSGPIQFEGSYTFEPVDEGTRFNFTIGGEVGAFSALIGPLAARMAKRQVETDAARLKGLLESAQQAAD